MTQTEPFVVVVSMRTADHAAVIPGSGSSTCAKCGHAVNVSPSTVAIMEAHPERDWSFTCTRCLSIAPTDTVMPLTREQLAEVRDALKEAPYGETLSGEGG